MHYPFSGDAQDHSVGQHHGTVHGATLTINRFGTPNSAYEFDGTDDYIHCGNDSALNQDFPSFSISLWIFPYDSNENSRIINNRGRANLGTQAGYQLKIGDPGGTGFWRIYDSVVEDDQGYSAHCINCGNEYSFNEWHHIVVIYTGSTVDYYIDNELDATVSATSISDISNDIPTIIGSSITLNGAPNYTTQVFKGKIDDIRIYNRVLSPQEIDSLFMEEEEEPNGIAHLEATNLACTVHPNPADDMIIVLLGESIRESYDLQLLDPRGNLIQSEIGLQDRRYEIDISHLNPGIYLVKIVSNGQVLFADQLVVQ